MAPAAQGEVASTPVSYSCRLTKLNTTAHEYGSRKKAKRPDLAGGEQYEYEKTIADGAGLSFSDLGAEVLVETPRQEFRFKLTRPEQNGVPALSWGALRSPGVSFMYFIKTKSLVVSRSFEFFAGWEIVFTQYYSCEGKQ